MHAIAQPVAAQPRFYAGSRLSEVAGSNPAISAGVPCELRCQGSFKVSTSCPMPERRRGRAAGLLSGRKSACRSAIVGSMWSVVARHELPGAESSGACKHDGRSARLLRR